MAEQACLGWVILLCAEAGGAGRKTVPVFLRLGAPMGPECVLSLL